MSEDIENARKSLTKKDFEEYALLSPIEKIERRKLLTSDEDLRAMYEQEIKKIRDEQADREAALASEEEKMALARERALEMGPNFWQKIWWSTQNFSKNGIWALKHALGFLITLAMGMGVVALIALIAFAVVGAPLGFLIQSIYYGLGANFVFYLAAWAVMLFVGAMDLDGEKFITCICGVLMVILGYSNLFWANVPPNKGYVGIVTDKANIVMQTVDSTNNKWMKAPNWWRNEKVTWYDVIDSKKSEIDPRPQFSIETLLLKLEKKN